LGATCLGDTNSRERGKANKDQGTKERETERLEEVKESLPRKNFFAKSIFLKFWSDYS